MNQFPITFKQLNGLENHDDTDKYLETLNKLTPMVLDIFKVLNQADLSPRALQRELLEFFLALTPSGFLVCLGLRKTVGSQELLPPDRKSLVDSFTKPYITLTEEDLKRMMDTGVHRVVQMINREMKMPQEQSIK
eukprot:403369900